MDLPVYTLCLFKSHFGIKLHFTFLLSILLHQPPLPSHPTAIFSSLYFYSFSRTQLSPPLSPTDTWKSVPLSPHSLLSHPVLHPPALWTGSSAVTKRDTVLWLPLVNVSTTSSLRQRGKIHKRDGKYISFFILLYILRRLRRGMVPVLLNFSEIFTLKLIRDHSFHKL